MSADILDNELDDSYESFEFGDKNIKSSKLEFYKGLKGVTHRMAILLIKAVAVKTHFVKGHFICHTKKDATEMAYCCKKLGPSAWRFGTVVAVYRTDKDGEIDEPNNIKFELKAWLLSEDKFLELSKINRKYPFDRTDITVTCSEEVYQRLAILPAPESPIRQLPNWKKTEQEVALMEAKIRQVIARKLTLSEIKERLGEDDGGNQVPTLSTKVDYSNIVNNINV